MLALVLPGLAAARRVAQTRETRPRKAAPPLADRRRARVQSLRHRLVAQPSAITRITSARNAMRCSVFPALSQPLKVARCSSVNTLPPLS